MEARFGRWGFLQVQPSGASDPIQHRGKALRFLPCWISPQEMECQAPTPYTLDGIDQSPDLRPLPTSGGDQLSSHHHLGAPGSGRIRPTIQPPGSLGSSWQSFLPCDQIVVPEASALVPRTTADVEPTSTKREPHLAGLSPRPQSRMDEQTDGSSGGFGGPPHQS